MQIGKRFFIIGLLALLAFQSSLVIGNYFKSAAVKTPFGWQDEGYVLGPALKVYEEGWKSYRCRGDQIICYGTVHTFFDVLVLKALPDSWVKDSPLLEPSGPKWFYQAKYPNAFVALRVFRVVLAGLLLGLVAWVAARHTHSLYLGMGWALAIPSFETFRSSRMGLKNDFSFALYLVFFLLLAGAALSSGGSRRSRNAFILAVIVGVIGISVKFGIILPLALLIPAYFLSSLAGGMKVRSLVVDFIFAGVGAGLVFLLTNPTFAVSLGEANWFSSFLAATGRIPTSTQLREEFFGHLVPNLWPLPFLLAFILQGSFQGKLKWDRKEGIRWLYLAGVPIVWAFLTWKSAYHRSAYYLPILVWIFVAAIWTQNRNRAVVFLLSCALAVQAAMGIPSERNASVTTSKEPWLLFKCESPNCQGDRWVVDRTVRAAIPREVGEANVLYFDSLVDSPRDLERLIQAKWSDAGAKPPRVLTTCWQSPPSSPSDPAGYYSPAAGAWSQVLKDSCPRSHPINANAAFAFENGWRSTEFAVLSLRSGNTKEPLAVLRNALSPRMLSGSWQGIDSWYAPVILKSDAVLQGEFVFSLGLSEVTLPVESTCKGSGEITLEVGGKQITRSADTRAVLCGKRPWVCRAGLLNWWTERIPLDLLSLTVNIPRQSRATIRITVKAGDPDRCRISLGTIRFTAPPSGTKVKE